MSTPKTLTSLADVEFKSTETESGTELRKFSMLAYSGSPVKTRFGSMIVDLDGLEVDRQDKPILLGHNTGRIAGQSKEIDNTGKKLLIDGTISNFTEAGKEVAGLSDEGFPWQASIGFGISRIERLEDDESETVNGRKFEGPGYIVTKSELLESSFVPLGADKNTSGVVMSDDLVTCFNRDGHAGVVEFINGDSTMTKDTDPKLAVAKFSTDYPDAVEQWKQDGHEEGVDVGKKAERERFDALKAEFSERPAFVCEQFSKGSNVDQAKAEYAVVLEAELADSQAENAKLSKKLAEMEDGDDGVQFSEKPVGDGKEKKLTAREEWNQNVECCQDEFPDFEAFSRFKDRIGRYEKEE